MPNSFVTLDRAARDLCVHIGTMRRWVREGRVPAKKIGRKYLISSKVFEELMVDGSLPVPPNRSKAGDTEPLDILSFWLQFEPSWYRHLYLVAKTCSLTASQTLIHGIDLLLKECLAKQMLMAEKECCIAAKEQGTRS